MEVDVIVDLVEDVTIEVANGHQFTQKVLFEEKPKFCLKCNRLGHVC